MGSDISPLARPGESFTGRSESLALVSTLKYRSRAVAPMSELDLHRLARAARLRNGREGVTGFMVYDRGWIFQGLEGPAEGLDRVWKSIRRDRRHAAIDVVAEATADKRQFQGWGLKLSVHGAQAGLGRRGMTAEPSGLIDRLCRGEQPESLRDGFEPAVAEGRAALIIAREALRISRSALIGLIETAVAPRLRAAQRTLESTPSSPFAKLAALLAAVDPAAATAVIQSTLHRYASFGSLSAELLEPTARALGDLWRSDECSEIEVTLGLIRLQYIAREFGLATTRLSASHPPVVLVAPHPGEAHMLGAVLDAEMLWQAGWSPRVDFPANSGALDTLVAGTWIDALDLSLSTCFRRDHRLDQVERTIASARIASLNPDMVVVVSGRAFSDALIPSDGRLGGHGIGADGTFGSASDAQSTILSALRHPLKGR